MLIALSGGIGSGKSIVSRILISMGYPVFDCDSEARRIMDSDSRIHKMICESIHPDAVKAGCVDRKLISGIVFSNPEALNALNSIVHNAVFSELSQWTTYNYNVGHRLVFVESAILHTSGLVDMVNAEWRVAAPLELRIRRVMLRSALTRPQVLARINVQEAENRVSDNIPLYIIDNSSEASVLPQIHSLLNQLIPCE